MSPGAVRVDRIVIDPSTVVDPLEAIRGDGCLIETNGGYELNT